MTNLDNINLDSTINLDSIWTPAPARRGRPRKVDVAAIIALDTQWSAPTVAKRVGRPAKALTKMQLRIESIVMGVLVQGLALRMEELTAITGYTAAQIRPIMQRLVAAGVVCRTGNTRGTRYQAVGL